MILARMAQTTLISREQIEQRVAEMAKEISAEFQGTDLIALCVLKGAMFFCADLVRQMTMDVAGTFTFDTPQHYSAEVTTKGSIAGQSMETRVTIDAERVGECP